MEIRNLPIPVPQYPVSNTEHNATSSSRQKSSGEEYARSVKASEQSQSTNTALQQQAAIALRSQLQQRPQHQDHNGNLHNAQLRHSTQQAINTYMNIEHQNENNTSAEVLSRIDTLV